MKQTKEEDARMKQRDEQMTDSNTTATCEHEQQESAIAVKATRRHHQQTDHPHEHLVQGRMFFFTRQPAPVPLSNNTNISTIDCPSLRDVPIPIEWNKMNDDIVKSFIRQQEFGCSIQEFWTSLYEREKDLIILPSHCLSFYSTPSRNPMHQSSPIVDPPPADALVKSVWRYPNASVTPTARESVIRWMSKVAMSMGWKRSTFFVAVHAMDRYILSNSPVMPSCSVQQQCLRSSCCCCKTCRHLGYGSCPSCSACRCGTEHLNEILVGPDITMPGGSIIPGGSDTRTFSVDQLTLLSTAALFLGVATEEEHNQAHRAKLFVQDVPNVVSIKQIFVQQLDILTTLTDGLLITKTPEDFLYYYLGNLRESTNPRYSVGYKRLIQSNPSTQAEHGFTPRVKEEHNSNRSNSRCLTLTGMIDCSLTMATLSYEKGGYAYLPASRLIAACLVPLLSISILPELSMSQVARLEFASEILHFHQPEALELTLVYCLPMLKHYLHQSLLTGPSPRLRQSDKPFTVDILKDLSMVYSTFSASFDSPYLSQALSHSHSMQPKPTLHTNRHHPSEDNADDTSTTISSVSSLSSSSISSSSYSILSSMRAYSTPRCTHCLIAPYHQAPQDHPYAHISEGTMKSVKSTARWSAVCPVSAGSVVDHPPDQCSIKVHSIVFDDHHNKAQEENYRKEGKEKESIIYYCHQGQDPFYHSSTTSTSRHSSGMILRHPKHPSYPRHSVVPFHGQSALKI